MRKYNQNKERNYGQEYPTQFEEEFTPAKEEPQVNSGESLFRRPARIRVTLKNKFNNPARNFKEMFQEFKRRVNTSGLLQDFKAHQSFESPSEKDRRSRRDSEKRILMDSLTQKIIAGERILEHGSLVKKIKAQMKKEKEKKEKKKERYNKSNDDHKEINVEE